MSKRVLFLIAALLLIAPLQLFAQAGSTEVGFRLSTIRFEDTTEIDEDGEEATLEFREDLGYGIALNHYWTNAFSTELAVDKMSAELDVAFNDIIAFTIGEADVTMISATGLWHFNRAGRVSPYVGGGAAYFDARFDIGLEEEVTEEFDVDNELTWLAMAGVDVKLSERVSLSADARYAPYSPTIEGETDEEDSSLDINPLMVSAGIKFRF